MSDVFFEEGDRVAFLRMSPTDEIQIVPAIFVGMIDDDNALIRFPGGTGEIAYPVAELTRAPSPSS
ncbi:MAG TPA: hypothetical protein VGO81_00570 [Solirubrobacteraceae bacterium]|jgi:hypothetical protein|nr:hypothetical protein [Solirubrobacteraceae bacterium]